LSYARFTLTGVPTARRPDPFETMAFAVVNRVLEVEVEHWDRAGRQGAVDGRIHLGVDRFGALEVTSTETEESRAVSAQLAKDRYRWPNPGRWMWWLHVDSRSAYRQAKSKYMHAIEVLEAAGASCVHLLLCQSGGDERRFVVGSGVA
jgi:hypothetical protein